MKKLNLLPNGQVPGLRAQAEFHFKNNAEHPFRPEIPASTRAALETHAPTTWNAWESGAAGFDAVARMDSLRLSAARARDGKISDSGQEALDAIDVLIVAATHTDRVMELSERAGDPRYDDALPGHDGARPLARHSGPPINGEHWFDRDGRPVQVYRPQDSLARAYNGQRPQVSLGEFLHAVVTGRGMDRMRNDLNTTTDASGGYSVPDGISQEFIDRLRAQSALVKAGARTLPMSHGQQTLCRITADPTIAWRAAENASITPSDPTFGAMILQAKTGVALVKLSLELVQDSVNAQEMVTRALVKGAALALDKAGLHGATNGPTGLVALSGRTQVTSVGAPNYDALITGLENLAAADVDLAKCTNWIMSPRSWGDIQRLKTGITNDNTPRPMPPAIADHKLLPTSSVLNTLGAGSDSVIFGGDFSDVVLGVRQEITVKVLPERFLGDSLSIGVLLYFRADWGAMHPASVLTLEGVTNV